MEPFDEKKYQYLLYLKDKDNHYHKFLSGSKFFLETTTSFTDLHLLIDPEIFKTNQEYLNSYKIIIREDIRINFNINIRNVHVHPDLENFHILSNTYILQKTPWQEIDNAQQNLLIDLQKAKTIIDYQNVGNSARTILKKIALLVFDHNKHIAPDGIDLGEDKYKNRLHTYIKSELSGSENKDFRHFIESLITSCEKSIDLCNTLTHDLNATAFMAESSVIGLLTTINFIRLLQARKS